jgi:phosphoribosylglycinamide formyltransferase-1
MKKMVVLISGRGSNMEAIARACATEDWPAQIVSVIANRPACEGLQRAAELGLPVRVVDDREFAERSAFEAALMQAIDAAAPELVVLAGFMRVLGAQFVRHYAGCLLNVHPSLLPAFRGLHTHRRALEAGVRVHGATVHFVVDEVDGGPIVAQAAVPVLDEDTEQSLAERVLEAEHRLYPLALRWWADDRLRLEGSRVELLDPRPDETRLLWDAS